MRRSVIALLLAVLFTMTAVAAPKVRKAGKSRKPAKTVAPAPAPERWALVNVAAACLRTEPAHSSQLETQASYGTPAKILDSRGEWSLIELPDGYKAWMTGSSFIEMSPEKMKTWRSAPRVIVTQPRPAAAYSDSINTTDGNIAFDVVIGSIFEGRKSPGARFTELTLPDGRKGYVRSSDVEDFASWSKKLPDIETIMDVARSMMGTTYLWGGTTPKAVDCSGFTKLSFGAAGLILPRNASQQARIGQELPVDDPDSFRTGDLLFFGSPDGKSITHVAIYDGFSRYLHASGRVFESSFKPGHPLYLPRKVIAARRLLNPETTGSAATSASTGLPHSFATHPWYF